MYVRMPTSLYVSVVSRCLALAFVYYHDVVQQNPANLVSSIHDASALCSIMADDESDVMDGASASSATLELPGCVLPAARTLAQDIVEFTGIHLRMICFVSEGGEDAMLWITTDRMDHDGHNGRKER